MNRLDRFIAQGISLSSPITHRHGSSRSGCAPGEQEMSIGPPPCGVRARLYLSGPRAAHRMVAPAPAPTELATGEPIMPLPRQRRKPTSTRRTRPALRRFVRPQVEQLENRLVLNYSFGA